MQERNDRPTNGGLFSPLRRGRTFHEETERDVGGVNDDVVFDTEEIVVNTNASVFLKMEFFAERAVLKFVSVVEQERILMRHGRWNTDMDTFFTEPGMTEGTEGIPHRVYAVMMNAAGLCLEI